jgi:hypothetical protein
MSNSFWKKLRWQVKGKPNNLPHQFRTRNDRIKAERRRSIQDENAGKSTNLTFSPPLVTVWLQVRVLPGPPVNQTLVDFQLACRGVTAPGTPRFVARCHASAIGKLLLHF